MLKNYLKTGLRNLSRNKVYTLINIVGLALGIGCALVIYKVVSFENSFDKHHTHYQNIYRIVNETIYPDRVDRGMGTPHPVGSAVREDFPEISNVVRTHYVYGGQINVTQKGELRKFLLEEGLVFTENSFFQIFDIPFHAGDKSTALLKPKTAVVSLSHARKLFGLNKGEESKAIGKILNHSNQEDFEVVAVVEDPPEATNFPFHILLEYSGQEKSNSYFFEGKEWHSSSSSTNTYLLVDNAFDVGNFNSKLVGMIEKYYDEGTSDRRRFLVQPLAAIHGDDIYGNYVYATSSELITALSIIAIFLVFTACINFVNLATAQAANRSKEIGIRKAIGGYTNQLVLQFFVEIAMITLFALFCSLAFAEFMFVYLEEVIGTRLSLNLMGSLETLGFLFLLLILVSFFSGFYPSFLLSRMNTVSALKNKITAKNNSGGLSLRKALVVTQFAISQFLIIGTVIIGAQMKYFLTKQLGFEKEAIVKSYLPERDEVKNERLRQLLLNDPSITDVSFALSSPTGNSNSHSNFNYAPLESEDDYEASYKPADHAYMGLYGLELLAGRGLDKNDSLNRVVINRKTADLMGFENNYEGAIGEQLTSGWRGQKLSIIGVMENFHSQELSEELQFVFLLRDPEIFYEVAFKSKSGTDIRRAVTKFEDAWEKVYPEYVVDWRFFDEELAENYEQEQSIATLMHIFSAVSIIIGCLGLYGLIAFIAANRTKEVGIRKVLGASVFSIITRFNLEIMILVVVSFLIAAPVSYFVLKSWLEGYTYRIDMGVSFFLLAFGVTVLIALVTVSHRTITTALVNPSRTLKDE